MTQNGSCQRCKTLCFEPGALPTLLAGFGLAIVGAAELKALSALHVWLHRGTEHDCDLIEAAEDFHGLVAEDCAVVEASFSADVVPIGGKP